METPTENVSRIKIGASITVLIICGIWMHSLNHYMNSSVWDCYGSAESDYPSFDQLPDYKNVTYSFENICAHGMIVCAWVILSVIGYLVLLLSKVNLGELVVKGLLIAEAVCAVLSAGWLLNASF
jgi:hypothetical protein